MLDLQNLGDGTACQSIYCDSGWTERDFGSKRKCYKAIGKYRSDEAAQKCQELGASLPLPRSDAEHADLLETADALGVSRIGSLIFYRIQPYRNFCPSVKRNASGWL